MIYFDTEKEAYADKATIDRFGKTYLTECTNEEYTKLQTREKIWQSDEIVDNPNYESELLLKQKEIQKTTIQKDIEELDKKRIRAIAEPLQKTENMTWLQYYNQQIQELREAMADL